MRIHSLICLAALSALPASASAQGIITSRYQSFYSPVPTRFAIEGDVYARPWDIWHLEEGVWVEDWLAQDVKTSVAIDGGRVLFGNWWSSYDGNFNAGKLQLRSRIGGAWTVDAVLKPSDPRLRLELGTAVGFSGDTAAGAARGWRPIGQPRNQAVGAAYVFRLVAGSWIEEALLTPAVGEWFTGVALDGDTLAVICAGATGNSIAVCVFQRTGSTWTRVAALPFTDMLNPNFVLQVQEDVPGSSTTILVRNSFTATLFTGFGANWQQQDIAVDSVGGAAISGSILALGDMSDAPDGTGSSGSVHLYQRDSSGTWIIKRSIFGSDPREDRRFGRDIAIDGERLAVGSQGFGNTAPFDLAIDMFRTVPIDASEYCGGMPNSTGEIARIASSGSASVSANEFELIAGPVPQSPGLFFYGGSRIQVPLGDGINCVGAGSAGVFRLPVVRSENGLLTYSVDFNAIANPAGQILAGSTWNFQAWYREPAQGSSGLNLSTGLETTFLP